MLPDRLARSAIFAFAAIGLSCNGAVGLAIELLTVPPSVLPGEPFTTRSRVCNRGDAPSGPATLEFAVRPIAPAGPEVPVGGRSVPPLEPGQCHTEDADLSAPDFLPDGAHRLRARIAPVGALRDSEIFGIGYLPNLVVEELAGPPSVPPGSEFTVVGSVCNRGTSWASGAGVSLYLSEDLVLVGAPGGVPGADLPLGEAAFPGMPPGSCVPFELTTPGPAVAEGVYLLGAIADEQDFASELVESDNARLLGAIAFGWMPDLVVASLDGPGSAWPGSEMPVEAVVCNEGTVPSPPAQVSLFLSEDGAIEPPGPPPALGDHPLGALPLPSIPPGVCHTQAGPVYASAPFEGAWTLGAIVDEMDMVEEFLEINNAFAGPLMGIGFGPDLVVEAIDAPPSAGYGPPFEVAVEVCNRGTSHADPSEVRLFHSSDAVLDGPPFFEDYEIGTAPVDALPPGACAETLVEAWAGPIDGPATVIAQVDPWQVLPELIETNNTTAGPVMGVGWDPDLVVVSIAAPPSVDAGAAFDATVEVCNQGTSGSPPAVVHLYHSEDAVLSGFGPVAGPDWFAGEIPVAPYLPAGACVQVSGELWSIPEQGAYHLGAVVDAPEWVEELLEVNNAFVGPLMGVGYGPDLVVTQLSAPPSALPGDPLPLDFEVCNQGTAPSPAVSVTFYDSADAVIHTAPFPPVGDDRWLGEQGVPSLDPGSCHAGSAPAWLPPGELGERFVGAIVDEWNSVSELVETNNVHVGPVVGVGSGPDLVVAQLLAPPSVPVLGGLTVDTQVCNQGTAPSPSSEVWLYLSADEEVEGSYSMPGSDPWLASAPVPPLAPGACHEEAVWGAANVPVEGVWHVGAIVDEGQFVPELVESNNSRLGAVVGVGSAPDLVITALSGPSSAPVGESFFVDVQVCNQGTEPSLPSNLLVYHSEDLVIDGVWEPLPYPDPVLANVTLPGLLPGSCHDEHKSVTASAPGAGFLAATIDEENVLPELIEVNNERLGAALEVTAPL